MITRDDIIKMAREAGLLEIIDDAYQERADWGDYVERFAALVAAAERERIEAERLKKPQPLLPRWGGCPVCSIGSKPGVYGVVCTRGDCPTRVTCTGAV